jgi:hypothetical protein
MMDVSTLALNMTFLMTLGIGFLFSFAHVLMFPKQSLPMPPTGGPDTDAPAPAV